MFIFPTPKTSGLPADSFTFASLPVPAGFSSSDSGGGTSLTVTGGKLYISAYEDILRDSSVAIYYALPAGHVGGSVSFNYVINGGYGGDLLAGYSGSVSGSDVAYFANGDANLIWGLDAGGVYSEIQLSLDNVVITYW
jgi:hypothetical protein